MVISGAGLIILVEKCCPNFLSSFPSSSPHHSRENLCLGKSLRQGAEVLQEVILFSHSFTALRLFSKGKSFREGVIDVNRGSVGKYDMKIYDFVNSPIMSNLMFWQIHLEAIGKSRERWSPPQEPLLRMSDFTGKRCNFWSDISTCPPPKKKTKTVLFCTHEERTFRISRLQKHGICQCKPPVRTTTLATSHLGEGLLESLQALCSFFLNDLQTSSGLKVEDDANRMQ